MTRTAARVAAAVGATVVMMGLATPALACTNMDAGGRAAAVSSAQATSDQATSDQATSDQATSDQATSDQAKNDPGKALGKHDPSLTLAEAQAKLDEKVANKLAWLDAVEATVAASDMLSAAQKTAFLAHLQGKEDALTQLRGDLAAATTLDDLRAVLKSEGADLFGFHHLGNFGHHKGGFGDRHHNGGFGGDSGNRSDSRSDSGNRGVSSHSDNHGGNNHGGNNHGGNSHGGNSHGGGFHH
jgi:hypothetical protein